MPRIDKGWVLAGLVLPALFAVTFVINQKHLGTNTINLSESMEITTAGTYRLSGTIDDGMITVNVKKELGKVKLILDNLSIKNSKGPALACYSADEMVIELIGDNYLEDGREYADNLDEDVKGALYSKDDVIFQGDGVLNVMANYEDGIVGKDDLIFNEGFYIVSAVDDAVRAKEHLLVNGGTIKVLKSREGFESESITINDGKISIQAYDDGMNANVKNYSGVDADASITINGGEIYIDSGSDGLDSNGNIYLNGGYVEISLPPDTDGEALDASGEVFMNGSAVVIYQGSIKNDYYDYVDSENGHEYSYENSTEKNYDYRQNT